MSLRTGFVVSMFCVLWFLSPALLRGQSRFPTIKSVERQPLLAQVNRVADALEYLGTPLSSKTRT